MAAMNPNDPAIPPPNKDLDSIAPKRRIEDETEPPTKRARREPEAPDIKHPQPKRLNAALVHFRPSTTFDSLQLWLDSLPSGRPKSAPTMASYDKDGAFTRPPPEKVQASVTMPPTPTSSFSQSASESGSGRSLVESPYYRSLNLHSNRIVLQSSRDPVPQDVRDMMDYARQERDSPGPTEDEIRQDLALEALGMGASEGDVESYFQEKIFTNRPVGDNLQRTNRLPMNRDTVPRTDSSLKISTPVPDMLYGYNRSVAFCAQQRSLSLLGTSPIANSQDLLFPFFAIEFKAEGPSGSGNLWVATNQCLGASAACINIAERLRRRLEEAKNEAPLSSTVFSAAMHGTEARLYISWKQDDLSYFTTKVDSFLLQDPAHYIAFRKYVRNILDWGGGERLEGVQQALSHLIDEGKKRAADGSIHSSKNSTKRHRKH